MKQTLILPAFLAVLLAGCGEKPQVPAARGDAGPAPTAAAAAAKPPAPVPEVTAESVYERGLAAFRAKDHAKALADFSAVLGEASLPAGIRSAAWSARGVVELERKDFDAARISFLRALRLDSRNAAAHYHLGKVLGEVFNFHEAAAEQFALAAGCPDIPSELIQRIRGEILPALTKVSAAATAKTLGDGTRDAAKAKKLLVEGDALLKKKMASAAAKKYVAAFAADRSNEVAALKVAQEFAKVDKSAAAVDRVLDAYRVLIALRPSRLVHYSEAARFAYQNKRWALAAQIMDRAVAQRPEDPQALDLFIASLKKAGKTGQQEAWSAFRDEVRK